MTFRLIATDLDGTLLRSDGTVSQRNVDALQRTEAAGIVVVVATGRPLRWMRPVADALGHTGIAICANGALVYDLHTDEVVEVNPLVPSNVVKIIDAVGSAVPGVTFAVETSEHGFGQEAGYVTHFGDSSYRPRIAPIQDLITDDTIKLLIQHQEMNPDELLAAARSVAGGLAEFTHSSHNGLLEVSAAGVTKASTLARIAEQRGITADDVVAFGDMPNDLPMLAWAGVGYAMANAHPEVLAAAQYVAPANNDDGVAQVIDSLTRQTPNQLKNQLPPSE